MTVDKEFFITFDACMFQTRQQSTRTEPITVVIDDDSETNLEPAGLMISLA
jgi:hypothetical protein